MLSCWGSCLGISCSKLNVTVPGFEFCTRSIADGEGGVWTSMLDRQLSFAPVVGITSTTDTLSDPSFFLSDESFPRLDLGLVEENPARDTLSVTGGPWLERRLIQFKGDVTNVVRASGREVSHSLCHETDAGACLPNPPTKYIAWASRHQYKTKISISYQKRRPRT